MSQDGAHWLLFCIVLGIVASVARQGTNLELIATSSKNVSEKKNPHRLKDRHRIRCCFFMLAVNM